jgi:hypothetical protein
MITFNEHANGFPTDPPPEELARLVAALTSLGFCVDWPAAGQYPNGEGHVTFEVEPEHWTSLQVVVKAAWPLFSAEIVLWYSEDPEAPNELGADLRWHEPTTADEIAEAIELIEREAGS